MSNHVYPLRLTYPDGAEVRCTWIAPRPFTLNEFGDFFVGRKVEIVEGRPSQAEAQAKTSHADAPKSASGWPTGRDLQKDIPT